MTGNDALYTVEVLGPDNTVIHQAKIYGLIAASEYLPDEYWGHISIVKPEENYS